jgi:hypothetical protein
MDVLTDLRTSDIDALKAQAKMLGVPAAALRRALASGTLSDAHAREIEWAVNKPRGWMDSGHRGEPE